MDNVVKISHLSKREYLAALFLSAIMSNPKDETLKMGMDESIVTAVGMADALIEKLNGSKENE